MLDQLKAYIDNEKLLQPDDHVLVGVSGGVDSMVLVSSLKALNYQVEVGHMNYQLRGDDSDQDEILVKSWCKQNDIPFHARRVELSGKDGSTQMQARKARFEWLNELVERYGFTKVALAHHLDDALETVLLNLAKGTGLTGLKGISSNRDNIIRPLMCFSKDQILDYAKSVEIEWREDASNRKSDYQRNLMRNKVMPELRELNPSLTQTFQRTQKRFIASEKLIMEVVEQIEKIILRDGDISTVPMNWRRGDDRDDEILYRLLRPFKVSFQVIQEILSSHESGKIFQSNTHQICMDRDRLIVSPIKFKSSEILVMAKPGSYRWGNYKLEVSEHEFTGEFPSEKHVAMLNANSIKWPLKVRSWEQGDVFQPLGMKGKKKVSDFMIDLKIPVTLKKDIPLFASGNDIVWVGGLRIDERFKVSDDTEEVIKIELRKNG